MALITTLNPVQIRTVYVATEPDIGLSGTAVLNPASQTSLQSYHSIQTVAHDYDPSTKIYQQADLYFQGNGGLFQVINYASNVSTVTPITPATTSSSSSSSSTSGSGSSSSDVQTFTPASSTNGTQASSNQSSDIQSALAALTKYYYAGWEYLLIEANDSNHDFINAIASLVNEQNRKILFIDIPTDTNTPDFSWVAPFKDSNSVFIISGLKTSNYNFGASLISKFCTMSPRANIEYVPTLEDDPYNVEPQTKYEFGDAQLNKYYNPYHVSTLVWGDGSRTKLTDNHVSDFVQLSTMVVRDYIAGRMQTELGNLLWNNADKGLAYNQNGIDLIENTMALILKDCSDNQYITDYKVHHTDANTINDYKKASGELQLPGYEWKPVNNINDMTVNQDILLPAEN